jgi:hypothetical protein
MKNKIAEKMIKHFPIGILKILYSLNKYKLEINGIAWFIMLVEKMKKFSKIFLLFKKYNTDVAKTEYKIKNIMFFGIKIINSDSKTKAILSFINLFCCFTYIFFNIEIWNTFYSNR